MTFRLVRSWGKIRCSCGGSCRSGTYDSRIWQKINVGERLLISTSPFEPGWFQLGITSSSPLPDLNRLFLCHLREERERIIPKYARLDPFVGSPDKMRNVIERRIYLQNQLIELHRGTELLLFRKETMKYPKNPMMHKFLNTKDIL